MELGLLFTTLLVSQCWIEDVATEFTALLALVDDAWISAKAEYVKNIMASIMSIEDVIF